MGKLADAVGMSVQAVSNQLQRLVDQKILAARRDGNHPRYRIIDPDRIAGSKAVRLGVPEFAAPPPGDGGLRVTDRSPA